MGLFDELIEKANKRKYKEHYEKAEEVMSGLDALPSFDIPYEILDLQPEEIYMNNEKAYEFLTATMEITLLNHKELQDMGNYYFDKICFLKDCIDCSIAKKRLYERLELHRKFWESQDFLGRLQGMANQYYDKMVSQYKVCESGAYGEYKVNEKLKDYAKEHGGIVLENIRLEVGIDRESAETDTLYITDKAIYSIETKYFGNYKVWVDQDNNWYKNNGGNWQSMDKSPSRQSLFHVRNLKNFFEEKGTDFDRLPIIPVVVMANLMTSIQNEGNVRVYSIDHLNELLFNKRPPIINRTKQLQIQKLIVESTLAGKPYRFFDCYGYLQNLNNKIREWFTYYDEVFEIVLNIFKLSDCTTYVYKDTWKVIKAEKQILGDGMCHEWHNTYYQLLSLRKERRRFDENFGEHYFEMALQRK